MDTVHLSGAEDVRRASVTMSNAADQMMHAAREIGYAVERLENILGVHATTMGAYVDRIEAALAPKQAMCSKCKQNPEMAAHLCPYRVTCSGDTVTMCNCCDDCQGDCSAEIP